MIKPRYPSIGMSSLGPMEGCHLVTHIERVLSHIKNPPKSLWFLRFESLSLVPTTWVHGTTGLVFVSCLFTYLMLSFSIPIKDGHHNGSINSPNFTPFLLLPSHSLFSKNLLHEILYIAFFLPYWKGNSLMLSLIQKWIDIFFSLLVIIPPQVSPSVALSTVQPPSS